jgi:hypothetical protein
VSDIVLHEMTHIALFQDGADPAHKSEAWYAEVRRQLALVFPGREFGEIRRGAGKKSVREPNPAWTGPGCGVPKTVVRKAFADDGCLSHKHVAHWPHSFRGLAWYAGDPGIGCPSY